MNSQSPEDRLLDELLREHSKAPDEAFLQQIEAAIDAGPAHVVTKPARSRKHVRIAIAAGFAMAAGVFIWSPFQNRKPLNQTNSVSLSANAESAKAPLERQELDTAIQDQEEKVEERRKTLATIVRTKGIIYKGQDSFYDESEVGEDYGARSALQASNDSPGAEGRLDDLDAGRELEANEQQPMKAMPVQLDSGAGQGAGPAAGVVGIQAEMPLDRDLALRQPRPRIVPPPAPAAAPADIESLSSAQSAGRAQQAQRHLKSPPPGSVGLGMTEIELSVGDKSRAGNIVREETAALELNSGDRYGAFIDQPWKSPVSDPLSTFSIDVDTASYGNIRRMIREGRSIPRDAVRIEECVNAFSYSYAPPKGDGPFAVSATLAACPWAPANHLVRVAIKGREIDANKRPASNLVFLIDVSGSMQSPDKLPLLKQAMATLVEQLDERDRVAIVVYAGTEGVALPSTRLDPEGRATVLQSLSKLEAGGSTNGGAGIKRAYELALAQKIEGGVNRVILATDGDFNVGVTGQESLVELVKDRAKGGVYLTVVGFGSGNLNDAMMDAITRDGNGNYFYIDSEREGRKVFLQNLTGTLVTIAKDVKIQVEFNPAKVGSYRLIGYANRVLRNQDFSNDRVDAGDIGAGHSVTAFYELTPAGAAEGLKYQAAPSPPDASADWLTVKLRHKHPQGDESRLIEFPLTGEVAGLDQTDPDFQFATAVALFGMKLRGMEEVRDVAWQKVIDLAKPGLANDATEDRAEFVELVHRLARVPERIVPAPAEVTPGR